MMRTCLHALLVALLVLSACAPAQRIYSLDPVTPSGRPLRWQEVRALRLENGQVVAINGSLELEGDHVIRNDGSSWPLRSIHSIDYVDERSQLRRARVESPEDLLAFDPLPRIAYLRLRDGSEIDLGDDNPWSSWSDDRLGILVSSDGIEYREVRLDELHTVTLYSSSFSESTYKSWQFWVVGVGAAALIYVISTRSEANQAIR